MTHGTHAPGRRRSPSPGPERLRGVWAGVIAILAVLAGILLVNLLNGAPDPKHPASPVAAATRTADSATLGATRSATPSASPSPRPSPSATRPAEKPPSPAPTSAPPATERPPPVATAPVVVLNNSRIGGLAESAARQVEAAGFPVTRTGNYLATYNVPVPTVFYDDAHRDAAQALMDAIPGIKKIAPRSQTQIAISDPLILVITRDFPADPEK
ncbi:LytR C-terminal domain-containing protein [Frankia sp. AgB32]|uniref:LytR C-terminal domain-containing protein n=1 Tax=Frankia sp. AgB32 TaxID=631119 RepID=UPI00200D4B49|nr:LytR C-terminal domain-containing protein [Frankia sp. AgB32]MCK9895723.1 LytR C-terminal domain-containing protein [Frankia sp. AgB32]